jgi:hypothetical protein
MCEDPTLQDTHAGANSHARIDAVAFMHAYTYIARARRYLSSFRLPWTPRALRGNTDPWLSDLCTPSPSTARARTRAQA